MILRYAAGSLGRAIRRTTLSAFVLFATPAFVDAQMTVTGRVTIGDQPVEGATVGIPSLDIETRTASDGRYNFLVRTSQVRGQTVAVVARHRRFGSQSAMVPLVGGSLVWNFDLSTPARTTAPSVTPPPAPSATIPPSNSATPPRPTASGASRPPGERRIATSMEVRRRTADSTAFEDVAGPLDLASALAGRIPGLIVTSASALGGSAPMVSRGSRSISGSAQPLVVLDGIPLDNLGFGSAAQQVGLGGFDYGTPFQDIPLESVASVTLLDPASATPLFGSRAANGVLLIATKQASPGAGFQYSVKQRFTMESPGRLPSYQNRYGQGLGGQFEFFDGAGGGINDAVDQSWGPALDGQPIAQASFFEPRRPDVRHFLPHASGVRDYFQSGRTYDASVMLSNAGDAGGFRLGVNTRDANGLTPNTNARRLGVSLGAFAQPTDRFSGRANVYATDNRAKHRPGTGYDEINPVAGFTRFGRQVDLAALRANIKDTAEQINWIYTARNNPFFQAFENANDDTRTHVIAGGALKYDLTQRLSAAVRLGIDDVEEDRNLNVANGWQGGFPTALGRADFSGGGTQKRTLASTEQTADVSLTATSLRSGGFDLGATAGFEARKSEFRATTAIADATAPGGGGPIVPGSDQQAGKGSVTSIYFVGTASRANYFMVNAGARLERSSAFPKSLGSALFPSISVTYDAAQTVTGLRERFGTARLRASWWRSGNEVTRRTLSQTFVAAATPTPRLGIPFGEGMLPERTTGIEFATEIASTGRRAGVDLTYYSERSSELLLTLGASGSDVFTSQLGEISNQGFEVQLHTIPFRGALGSSWELTVSLARNTNKIEKLAEGLDEVPLSPSIWGASMVARKGSPLGTIAGRRYLRDAATQALILRNGLPIPDDSGPLSILGSWRPDWTASVASKLRYRGAEFALLFDARRGGKIFSATNLWGSYAGTLESTVAERESGKLIPGIDSITGAANATAVSVEDYFHALGAIHEAWVYDASYAKLREARLSYETSLTYIPGLRRQTLRLSLIGRNLLMWAKAPNIDPETALSTGVFQGFEMGQLPSARSMGLQLSITP